MPTTLSKLGSFAKMHYKMQLRGIFEIDVQSLQKLSLCYGQALPKPLGKKIMRFLVDVEYG
jgi:hypothetical protein